jgi:hypothetical protein
MERRTIRISFTAILLLLSACGCNSGGTAAPVPSSQAIVSTPSLSAAVVGDNTFSNPEGIFCDGFVLYLSDTQSFEIRKITIAGGLVSTLAGTGSYGAVDGPGLSASFNEPVGITGDGANLYVVDRTNHAIRRIRLSDNAVTTLAGEKEVPWDGSPSTYDNIVGTSAHFTNPYGIVVVDNSLYVTDSDNHTIRRIDRNSGEVSTFAGLPGVPGPDDGTGTAARFQWPKGIASDGVSLYAADSDNHPIRKVNISTGKVITLAGQAGVFGSNDNVVGTSARFNYPFGIATDGTDVYVADSDNHTLRKVSIATGAVTTIAGKAGVPGISDGVGDEARFDNPVSVTRYDGKTLYVMDRNTSRLRKISLQ